MNARNLPLCAAIVAIVFLASSAQARFLQTDPAGYADDLNMYTYVQDDPTDKTDPTGRYACGSSLEKSSCGTFMAAQNEAKAQLTKGMDAIGKLRADLKSGKLTAADKQLANAISARLGLKSGYEDKMLGRLVAAGSGIMGMLNSNMPAEKAPGFVYANSSSRDHLTVEPLFFRTSNQMRASTLVHESAHYTLVPGHTVYDIEPVVPFESNHGVPPYGEHNIRQIAGYLNDPDFMMQEPDAVTLSLGVPRDDNW